MISSYPLPGTKLSSRIWQ